MSEGATQTGVPEVQEELSGREAIYAAIDAKRADEAEPVGEPVEFEEPGVEEVPAEEPEVEAKSEEAEPAQPTEQMVRVKVDGEEQEVPLSKVLAQYQKHSAADKRLEEASRAIAEARALKAEMEALKQQAPKPQKKSSLPDDLADAFKTVVRQQLEVTDPEEYAALEEQKAGIIRAGWEREQQAKDQAQREEMAYRAFRHNQEQFLSKVAEKHPDSSKFIRVDLDEAKVELDPAFESWLGGQPPWMKHALLAPDPSGPVYVLDQFKASLVPNMADRVEAKRKMDVPPAANRRAERKEGEDDDNSPQAYVRQLQEMRAPRRAAAR